MDDFHCVCHGLTTMQLGAFLEEARKKRPNFPDELLVEWLYSTPLLAHVALGGPILDVSPDYTYSFLWDSLEFKEEVWPLRKVPGPEAMDGVELSVDDCVEDFDKWHNWSTRGGGRRQGNIESRAWLAEYMEKHGTWNTPVELAPVWWTS